MSKVAAKLESPVVRTSLVVAVLLVIGFSLAVPLRAFVRQVDSNAQLAATLEDRQERVTQLEESLEQWRTDEYAIAQARTRLHFVFPGETGYIVMGGDDPQVKVLPESAARAPDPQEGWYSKLWDSVERTRQPAAE